MAIYHFLKDHVLALSELFGVSTNGVCVSNLESAIKTMR